MNENDVLIKILSKEEICQYDSSSFSHFGWEGGSVFSFEVIADSYFSAANLLYNKILDSKGDYAIIDGLVYPMMFLYRHYTELTLKKLFIKFIASSEEEISTYLKKGHDLCQLWPEVKTYLSTSKQKVGSKVNIGALDSYIHQFNSFDPDSMKMRYPIDKKTLPNKEVCWLDYKQFAELMNDFRKSVEQIDYDISNQVIVNDDKSKIAKFEEEYRYVCKEIISFLEKLKKIESQTKVDRNNEINSSLIEKILNGDCESANVYKIVGDLSPNAQILTELLYYAGRAVSCHEVVLSKSIELRKNELITIMLNQMDSDHFVWGQAPRDEDINFQHKMIDSIIENVSIAVEILNQ